MRILFCFGHNSSQKLKVDKLHISFPRFYLRITIVYIFHSSVIPPSADIILFIYITLHYTPFLSLHLTKYKSEMVLFVCIHADIIKRLLRRLISLARKALQLPQGSCRLPRGRAIMMNGSSYEYCLVSRARPSRRVWSACTT